MATIAFESAEIIDSGETLHRPRRKDRLDADRACDACRWRAVPGHGACRCDGDRARVRGGEPMKIVLAMPGSKHRLEKQIENMTEIAPYLRAWMEAE